VALVAGYPFADRADAGIRLAPALAEWRGADAVVCGIPRGGVVVAAEVARALGLPLDVAVVRKLGATSNEEFAVGAIAEGVRVVQPDAVRFAGMGPEQLDFVEALERVELRRRTELFGGEAQLDGRTAIVVDDGIATGATAIAACKAVRARGAVRIVLATPVAPATWRPSRDIADDYVCLVPEQEFWAVGQFYRDFRQTTDAEVLDLLRRGTPASG
jgi:putative phosphoribosyl transferase